MQKRPQDYITAYFPQMPAVVIQARVRGQDLEWWFSRNFSVFNIMTQLIAELIFLASFK